MNLFLSRSLSLSLNCFVKNSFKRLLVSITLARIVVWSWRYFSYPSLLSGLKRFGGTNTTLMKNIVKELVCFSFPNITFTSSLSLTHTFLSSLYTSFGVIYLCLLFLTSLSGCWCAVDYPFDRESLDFFLMFVELLLLFYSSSSTSRSIKKILLAPYFFTFLLSFLQLR